jgi:hypothetical protein
MSRPPFQILEVIYHVCFYVSIDEGHQNLFLQITVVEKAIGSNLNQGSSVTQKWQLLLFIV